MYRFHTKLMCWVLTHNPASLCSKQQIAIACLRRQCALQVKWVISEWSLGDLWVTPECSLCDLWVCSQLPFKVHSVALVMYYWFGMSIVTLALGWVKISLSKLHWELTKSIALNFVFTNFEQKSLGWEVAQNTIVFFVVQSLHSVCWNFAVHWAEFNGI